MGLFPIREREQDRRGLVVLLELVQHILYDAALRPGTHRGQELNIQENIAM